MGMLPSVGPFSGLQKAADKVDEKQIDRVEAIINSMTAHERPSSTSDEWQSAQTHRPRIRHQRAGSEQLAASYAQMRRCSSKSARPASRAGWRG